MISHQSFEVWQSSFSNFRAQSATNDDTEVTLIYWIEKMFSISMDEIQTRSTLTKEIYFWSFRLCTYLLKALRYSVKRGTQRRCFVEGCLCSLGDSNPGIVIRTALSGWEVLLGMVSDGLLKDTLSWLFGSECLFNVSQMEWWSLG